MITIPDALRRPAEVERDELRRRLAEIEEREAACCPEGVPFDEYIKALESKFEQMLEALEKIAEIGRQKGDARPQDAVSCFLIAEEAIKAAKEEI